MLRFRPNSRIQYKNFASPSSDIATRLFRILLNTQRRTYINSQKSTSNYDCQKEQFALSCVHHKGDLDLEQLEQKIQQLEIARMKSDQHRYNTAEAAQMARLVVESMWVLGTKHAKDSKLPTKGQEPKDSCRQHDPKRESPKQKSQHNEKRSTVFSQLRRRQTREDEIRMGIHVMMLHLSLKSREKWETYLANREDAKRLKNQFCIYFRPCNKLRIIRDWEVKDAKERLQMIDDVKGRIETARQELKRLDLARKRIFSLFRDKGGRTPYKRPSTAPNSPKQDHPTINRSQSALLLQPPRKSYE